MDVNIIKSIVDAGSLVIALTACAIMWRAYNARIDAHIADLQRMAFRDRPMPPSNNPHNPHQEFAPSLN